MARVAGACIALVGFVGLPAMAGAQTDYRNLDDGRPVRTEDAFVADHHAFELLAPFIFDADVSGAKRYTLQPELEYGVLPNSQLSVRLPFGVVDSAGSDWGLGGAQLSAMYNFNAEGPVLPAFSARVDLALPVGALSGDVVLTTVKAVATRTFGVTRLHLNGAWTFGTSALAGPRLEASPRWFAGAAVDYTFFRSSILLVGEVNASQQYTEAPSAVAAAVGARWQWTPTLVLDAGIARRLTSNAGPDLRLTLGLTHVFGIRGLMPGAAAQGDIGTQPVYVRVRAEQFYYPGSFNWRFLAGYPAAARLFNAFDYGHATLYEHLLTSPPAERSAALEREYQYLTTDLLRRPPRFGVAEVAIEPQYARIARQARLMFDWAHVLHRQVYDVYADSSLSVAQKDSLIETLTDYYLSRRGYAFTAVPKSMALMDGQWFSQRFRTAEPRFNGLIWAYHWLQVGLYEPFVASDIPAKQKAGVDSTVAHFWTMLQGSGRTPTVMPMTPAVAPAFSKAHPRAAVIFDNLHMMHDIISDILILDSLSSREKGRIISQQLAEFRDGTRNVMTMDEWWSMGDMMHQH